MCLEFSAVESLLKEALAEDIGSGDVTTQLLVPENLMGRARVIAQSNGRIAGLDLASWTFRTLDSSLKFDKHLCDGTDVVGGDALMSVEGAVRSILTGERTTLNLLAYLSGVATLTAEFVKCVESHGATITDTRKTTPGLRIFQKYAVRVGGGSNHRFGLYDAVLIKDNHIEAAGGIEEAVSRARTVLGETHRIEVEVQTLGQVKAAVGVAADIIMLDNMDLASMREAVLMTKGKAVLEASGGITLDNVEAVAKTGVDLISIGALTHSALSMDVSLDLIETWEA